MWLSTLHRGSVRTLLRLLFLASATTRFGWPADRRGWRCSAFVASCVVVSRVAERARRQTLRPSSGSDDVERLYALSQEMMLYEDADRLIRDLPRLIDRIFALEAWCSTSATRTSSTPPPPRLPASVRANLQALTQGRIRRRLVCRLPSPAMALMLGMRPVGALAGSRSAFARGGHGGQRAGGDCVARSHRH